MKRLAFFALLLTACASQSVTAPADDEWRDTYGDLLAKYVTSEGVRYQAWHASAADVASLDGIVSGIAATDLNSLSGDTKLAFYINAYNAWMLHEVLHAYPVDSVTDIAPLWGVFTNKRITVGGEKMSLNHLEKQVILKEFSDPRVHFAINCASRSCPPLLDEPYAGETLDEQLTAVSREGVSNNPLTVKIEGNIVKVFEVFDWYAADFDKVGGTKAFINAYREEPLPEGAAIEFTKYDWSLNEA